MHLDTARPQERSDRARERELRVLGRGVRARGRESNRAGNRDEVHDVRPCVEARRERAQAPDATEVVHARHALDELRVDVQEAAARGDTCIVDEQPDFGMPLEHPSRHVIDLCSVGDVADLPLAADLGGDPLELVGAPCEQHAAPVAPCQLPRRRLADA
jgi:hypothetical protein